MSDEAQKQLRAYVEYFRDLGVHDFYRRGEPGAVEWPEVAAFEAEAVPAAGGVAPAPVVVPSVVGSLGLAARLGSFHGLGPLPESRRPVGHRRGALPAIPAA